MPINRYIVIEQQAFDVETFAAFAANALTHPIDDVSEDISMEHGFVYTETSSKRLKRNRLLGPITNGGEIGVPVYTKGFPTLLYYALGAVETTVPSAGLYKHIFRSANSIPAFRMGVGKDINQHNFVGCAVRSLKIDYTVAEASLATFDLFVRKELAPASLISPTYPDYDVLERTFLGVEVVAKINDTIVGYVRKFSLEINNTIVDDNHGFGNRYVPKLIIQGLEISGNLSVAFDDIARYNDVKNEVEPKLELIFSHGTPATVGYREVSILLPKLSLDMGKMPTDGNKEYVIDMDFTAEVEPGDPDAIEITVYNEETNVVLTT